MKYISITMVMCLLIVGCSNPIIIERNITVERIVYNNTIEYIDNTVPCNPCNLTCPEPEIDSTVYDRQYVLGLIRQLKYYEEHQDKFVNQSSCMDDLNRTEYKLELAEEELCQWNSSWCN